MDGSKRKSSVAAPSKAPSKSASKRADVGTQQPSTTTPPTWAQRLGHLLASVTKRNAEDGSYAGANCDSVQRAFLGQDPYGTWVDGAAGARMVVNLSSAHVPAFCDAFNRGDPRPFKNCYDLALLGGWRVATHRQRVDAALPPTQMADVYFGAVELNGSGIRFYGDICLVLRRGAVDATTVVLDRNSFELLRAPVADQINQALPQLREAMRKRQVQAWQGEWAKDVGLMATVRALRSIGASDRRWTVGQISSAVRNDEDYIEVLKTGSFRPDELQEARISSADAAHDALVGSRQLRGPLPRLEALIWRHRRIRAERALRASGVPLRIVTTGGRLRG